MKMERSAGVLMPIFSLPSKYGIGCFDEEAYKFVDKLQAASQTYWQILPLGPTSMGDSPYQSFSTFAGNPYFIDLNALIKEGVLTEKECEAAAAGRLANPDNAPTKADDINYARLYNNRMPLLRLAYTRSHIAQDPEYQAFIQNNSWWLNDYALFMALKDFFKGVTWSEWPEDIRLHYGPAINYYNEKLYFDIEFQKYLQYKFAVQWFALKAYANSKDIKIIGDIPIYVSMDSSDCWANPSMFQLDENNVPTEVAGCPPDGFSPDGQLWGNPLYAWDRHEATGYQWWMTRLWYCFEMYDVVRIDHFRGFDEYFCIKYGEKTAKGGHWSKGPGMKLFNRMKEYLGDKAVIAEDLGFQTDTVIQMVKDSGFPSMKVMEFAFDARDANGASQYLPHNATENSVMYTGTHDNETIRGWFDSITPEELEMARNYVWDHRSGKNKLNLSMIASAMCCKSFMCIIPLQDYIGLDNKARINVPNTVGTNWRWRVLPKQLNDELFQTMRLMACTYGRQNWAYEDKVAAAKKAAEAKEAAAAEKEEEAAEKA